VREPNSQGASGEFSVLRFDAQEIPVSMSFAKVTLDESSKPVICAVVSDLTAIYRRSQKLLATNERLAQEIADRHRVEGSLQLALDAAGMGSWDLDLATGEAVRSRRHDEIFGLPVVHEPWGLKDALKQFVPEDAHRVASAFQDAKKCGAIDIEACIIRAKDNAQRWLRITGRTFYDQHRNPTRIAGVVTDITDRRAVEDRLRQAQKN
jgi:PAS domain-containing protein